MNKKYKFQLSLVIIAFISFSFNSAFQKEDTVIYWQTDRKLTWDDFQGEVPTNTNLSAMSHTGMEHNYTFKNNILEIDAQCSFEKLKSWSKINNRTDALLKHEQGHFDITEIYIRKFRKQITEIEFNSKNIHEKFENNMRKINSEYNNCQNLYDKETNHHINQKKQAEWEEKIANDLKELEAYSETHLTIQVK